MSEAEESRYKCAIASPMADSKLTKGLFKVMSKEAKHRGLKRGRKEIQKAIRKKSKGVLVLAADITPVDVVSHLPVLCEENAIPYVWVPSRELLGAAAGTKRATSCVLILPPKSDSVKQKYDKLAKAINSLLASVAV